jgi:hypothetical protein
MSILPLPSLLPPSFSRYRKKSWHSIPSRTPPSHRSLTLLPSPIDPSCHHPPIDPSGCRPPQSPDAWPSTTESCCPASNHDSAVEIALLAFKSHHPASNHAAILSITPPPFKSRGLASNYTVALTNHAAASNHST